MSQFILLSILFQSSIDDPNRFNNYLILGYVIMWVIGMVYIGSLLLRQRNVQQDLQLMTRILREDEETADF